MIAESFTYLGFYQMNSIPNNRNVYLDLLFSNMGHIKTERASDLLWRESTHHLAYTFTLSVPLSNPPLAYRYSLPNFKCADYTSLNDFFATVDWLTLFKGCDIDGAVNQFYEILYAAIDRHVPIKSYSSSSFPVWFSSELRRLVRQKRLAHKRYQETKSMNDYLIFFSPAIEV